jgi:amino-acid N-acetyltransferase
MPQMLDSQPHVTFRPAAAGDAARIRQMIRAARLDPTSLDWRHFLVAEVPAEDESAAIVGIGQVKVYPGCLELGSLVVLPEYRGQGIAAALIAALEARSGRPLYLLCRSEMEGFYRRFGYETISFWQAPLVLKLKLLPAPLAALAGVYPRVMRKRA